MDQYKDCLRVNKGAISNYTWTTGINQDGPGLLECVVALSVINYHSKKKKKKIIIASNKRFLFQRSYIYIYTRDKQSLDSIVYQQLS